MTTVINQYRLLFFLTWIVCYLIFPSWALPVTHNMRGLVYAGLLVYFCASALVLSRCLDNLDINRPPIVKPGGICRFLRDNSWFAAVCLAAVVLNIYPLTLPILIIGDEAVHLQNGLLIYEYIDSSWHYIFQILFWAVILLLLASFRSGRPGSRLSTLFSGSMSVPVCLMLAVLFCAYFFLLRDIQYYPSMTRYPPVAKILYFLTYSAFGISHVPPRVVQMVFYLLCGVYLYRTINLFNEKETALLGALIYLFLPVTFAYAHLGELISGTLFFIIAISYYFIRFLKEGNDRDLVLSVYLIGTGMLYKKPVFLMFIVCFPFLIYYMFQSRKSVSMAHVRVFMLSLVPVIPWMLISKYYSWRNFQFHLENFTSLESKVVTYLQLMASNVSAPVFVLFLLSVIYALFRKRNILTAFFGLVFCVYYFFMVADMAALSPRFSMTFYPALAVFSSLFTVHVLQLIRWKHAVRVFTVALALYLAVICTVSPFNKRYLRIMDMKLHYFPSEEAMEWVRDNVEEGERVLMLRMLTSWFYRYKYMLDRDRMVVMPYRIAEVSTPEKLKSYYVSNNISYIMFPYSPAYVKDNFRVGIFEYMQKDSGDEFAEVAKFNLGENYIYVYKYAPARSVDMH